MKNKLMNDWSVIGDLSYAQSILESPEGKHCKSPDRNVPQKAVPSSKAVMLVKELHIFAVIL